MKKLNEHFYIGVALILISIGSCIPDPVISTRGNGTVNIGFRAVYDSTVVVMDDESQTFVHLGDTIFFKELRFFISNVVLEAEETRDVTFVVPDDNVALYDLTTLDEPVAASLGESFPNTVLPGNYKGIRLNFGVPPELNVSDFDPNLFGGDHPLNEINHHWADINSYIFFELIGQIRNGTGFHYILGQDDFYTQSAFFGKSIILTDQTGDVSFDFKIDLKQVLNNVKVSEKTQVLQEDDLWPVGRLMMNNFVRKSLELE